MSRFENGEERCQRTTNKIRKTNGKKRDQQKSEGSDLVVGKNGEKWEGDGPTKTRGLQ